MPDKPKTETFPAHKFNQLNLEICQEIRDLEELETTFKSKYNDQLINILDYYIAECRLDKRQPKYFKQMLYQIQILNFEMLARDEHV